MRVVFYNRKPPSYGTYSIEQVFETMRAHLPRHIDPAVFVSRFLSVRVWGRLYNLIEAAFRRGDVNHVTGDMHYVTLLMRKRRTVLAVHDCGSRITPARGDGLSVASR